MDRLSCGKFFCGMLVLAILVMAGCSSSSSSSSSNGNNEVVASPSFFAVSDLITASTGTSTTDEMAFGIIPPSTQETSGVLTISPDSSVSIAIPDEVEVPDGGIMLELQINYLTLDESSDEFAEASFKIEDDQESTMAEGLLENDDYASHQSYTLQVDLLPFAGTSYIKLINTSSSYALRVNDIIALIPIDEVNDSGIYVADLRLSSSRIDTELTDVSEEEWDDAISTPSNYLHYGDVVFDLSDVVADMTQPVLEFNFGRWNDEYSNITLYDDEDTEIGYYYADYDSDEDMGQTFMVDITAYKDSSYFKLSLDDSEYLNPFVKIYDAADTSKNSILLDVSPTGSAYQASSGKFEFYSTEEDYPEGGMYDDDIGYGAPHWLADPTHPTYGQAGSLQFNLPSVVSNFSNPVLEIVHFSPDSATYLADEDVIADPGAYPVEYYLRDGDETEIAHIYFGEWEDDTGGVLKNQIPFDAFKDSETLELYVPATETGWSQMALPPFIKIMNVYQVDR